MFCAIQEEDSFLCCDIMADNIMASVQLSFQSLWIPFTPSAPLFVSLIDQKARNGGRWRAWFCSK